MFGTIFRWRQYNLRSNTKLGHSVLFSRPWMWRVLPTLFSFLFFNFLFPFSLLFLLQLFPLSPPPFSSATCIFFSSSTFSSLSSWENKGGQYFLLSLVASLKYQSSPYYVYNLYTVTSVVFVDRQKQSCGQRILTRYGMYGLYCTMFVFAFPKSSLPLILGWTACYFTFSITTILPLEILRITTSPSSQK